MLLNMLQCTSGTPITRKLPGPNFNGTMLGKSVAWRAGGEGRIKIYSRQSVSNGTSTFFWKQYIQYSILSFVQ